MFDILDKDEQLAYLDLLYKRLLEHRYRYYGLDEPVLDDFEYDYLERYYNQCAASVGAKLMVMVDFDFKDPEALAAKERVDSGIDSHSLWVARMTPIWNELGKPKFMLQEVAKREK